ncbi:MAG TPA: MBOAT family protein [Vicinamibacterales bacterium]|jgi:hypothetical protein
MWILAAAIYAGCKWLTWQRMPVRDAPIWQHAGYLLAWPGLDAAAFLTPTSISCASKPARREWAFALIKFVLGLWIVFGAARLVPAEHPYLIGWVGMIGIVMTLHFGMFHLLSCGWRRIGVDARPLMNRPLASTSVSEFWGRRWNTAFRDLTHRFLYRSLTTQLGVRWAILAGFVFSGLVHELVISVPARGGYGGPTLFFGVQGTGILFERSPFGRRLRLGNDSTGWAFTMLVLFAPVYYLFHPPFVEGIIVPFLKALDAL